MNREAEKKRLVKLWKEARKMAKEANSDIEREMIFTEHLLDNGVIVPPCKVGDTVYIIIDNPEPQIEKKIVESIIFGIVDDKVTFTDFTSFTVWFKEWKLYYKAVFPTKAEAEYALKLRRSVSLVDGHIEE